MKAKAFSLIFFISRNRAGKAHHPETFVNCHFLRLLTFFCTSHFGEGETLIKTEFMGYVRLLLLVAQEDGWAWEVPAV